MIKRFFLAAAATLLAAAPAASAYPQSNLSDGHRTLIEAINRAGVEVYLRCNSNSFNWAPVGDVCGYRRFEGAFILR